MDLSDISRERTLVDLAIARVRILDLTVKIEEAAAELAPLRAELAEARPSHEVRKLTRSAPSGPLNTLRLPALLSRRSAGQRGLQWHVDEICGQIPSRSKQGIEHMVRRNNSWAVTISGWVVPNGQSSAFTSARLLMTGRAGVLSRQASIHLRDDVAAHFGNPGFAMSGFRFEVPMSELTIGSYALDLVAFGEASGETTVRLGHIELA